MSRRSYPFASGAIRTGIGRRRRPSSDWKWWPVRRESILRYRVRPAFASSFLWPHSLRRMWASCGATVFPPWSHSRRQGRSEWRWRWGSRIFPGAFSPDRRRRWMCTRWSSGTAWTGECPKSSASVRAWSVFCLASSLRTVSSGKESLWYTVDTQQSSGDTGGWNCATRCRSCCGCGIEIAIVIVHAWLSFRWKPRQRMGKTFIVPSQWMGRVGLVVALRTRSGHRMICLPNRRRCRCVGTPGQPGRVVQHLQSRSYLSTGAHAPYRRTCWSQSFWELRWPMTYALKAKIVFHSSVRNGPLYWFWLDTRRWMVRLFVGGATW